MSLKKKNQGKIRIKDLAERAGVSIGTVDRVLHKRGEVKQETRRKVTAIVDEMGYTPNLLAKSLASKKTCRIAAIIPEAGDMNPYWEKPLKGIRKGAAEIHDFNTTVDIFTFNASNEKSFSGAVERMMRSKPAGVVFNPVFKKASLDFTELMDSVKIPYVYLDIDLEKGNNLAYFGQNAGHSGRVAAKMMSKTIPYNARILIVKLTNQNVITSHLRKREAGFAEFFQESDKFNCELISADIDILDPGEPSGTLRKLFNKFPPPDGVFVPCSRVFKVAQFIEEENLQNKVWLSGFDLLQKNCNYLQKGVIDFLISQKPEEQGYKSVMALFDHIVTRKNIRKTNYSPIDIIIKENIDFYT